MKNINDLCMVFFRIGLGGVFLWFGIDKFVNPVFWSQYLPQWFTAIVTLPPLTLISLIGLFEVAIALAVLLGIYTRVAAGIAAGFLFLIILSLGFSEFMVRDAGLLFLAMGLAIMGPGCYSIDQELAKRRKKKR